MDSILEIVWLIALAGFYLWNASRRSKARRKRQEALAQEGAGDATETTPFQEFMRQMDEAMREAAGEEMPSPEEIEKPLSAPDTLEPEPVPASPVPASPVPAARTEVFRDLGSFAQEGRFESARRAPHEERSFGLDQPFSEERFERLARGQDITEHDHPSLAPKPRKRRQTRAGYWHDRLQNPDEAQDALVLAEIFGGPWSPRRPHKR